MSGDHRTGQTIAQEDPMSFIKLEDHAKKGSSEYFIRTELIREVDIERDEQGQITTLDVYLMDGNYEVREDSRFSFEREDASKAYAVLYPFLAAAAPMGGA
jgi:hypothetical protein